MASAQCAAEETRETIERQKTSSARILKQLETSDRATLRKLHYREYFSTKLSAQTLRARILQKITHRKLEFDPIERSVRRTTSGMSLFSHGCTFLKADALYRAEEEHPRERCD